MSKKRTNSIKIGIGVTGSFGSGCTTLAKVIRDAYEFKFYSLSDTLREEWDKCHPEKPSKEALKHELQQFGNELRQKRITYLAEKTFKKVRKDKNEKKSLVFDSIRNPAEIAYLKNRIPNFYVIAVDCAESDRWDRVGKKDYLDKDMTYEDFKEDDGRDKNEEGIPYGQQVALCVDEADYLIRNDNDPMLTSKTAIKRKLVGKMQDPMHLFSGEARTPTLQEAYMSIAYAASLMSQCVKRQVGAVIIDVKGNIVSTGYNVNPNPVPPCHQHFGDCYREIIVEDIMLTLKNCPYCGEELSDLIYPYICPKCKKSIYRKIFRDRVLGRCTSLHAEEKAIENAGLMNLKGSTIYVTTFPCFHCAQQILEVGIKQIWFVESYPDIDSINLIKTAQTLGKDIVVQKFEGVKARAYYRFFANWRRQKESDLLESRTKRSL